MSNLPARLSKLERAHEARMARGRPAVLDRRWAPGAAPVVAGMEQEADWRRHLRAVCESLQPLTALEAVLAERVALLTWRLARVVRAETAAIERAQAGIDEAIHHAALLNPLHSLTPYASTWPEDIRFEAERHADLVRALGWLEAPDETPVSGEDAADLLNALYDAAASEAGADVPIPGIPAQNEDEELDAWCERVPWTAAQLRTALAAFAAHAGQEAGVLLATMRAAADLKATETTEAAAGMEAKRRRMQGERLVPDAQVHAHISRYEAQLERSLSHALGELARLQTWRAGAVVPLPEELSRAGETIRAIDGDGDE